MHLSEFVLLVVATVAAIAAGIAWATRNYRAARYLVWLGAITFGSMGIVWSQQSHGYSFAVQAAVAAAIAATGAVGLVWGLNEIRGRAANAEEASVAADKAAPGKNNPSISAGRDAYFGHIGDNIIINPPASAPTYTGKLEHEKTEVLFSVKEQKAMQIVEFADSGAQIASTLPAPVIQFAKKSELLLERINGELKVSTAVHDRKGNLIAEIVRNEWKIAPPPQTWDRNFNKNTLEVRDPTGNIVLQARLLPDRLQLQGEWWINENLGVRFYKSQDPAYPGGMISFDPPTAPKILPLFVYPSETHLGELL